MVSGKDKIRNGGRNVKIAHEDRSTLSMGPYLSPPLRCDSIVVCRNIHEPIYYSYPAASSQNPADKGVQMSSHVLFPILPFGVCISGHSFRVLLALFSLPYAAASPDTTRITKHDTSSITVLFVLTSLAILFTILPYITELKKTYELPKIKPKLPTPVCHTVGNDLSPYAHRNLTLRAPAVVWLVLSVVTIGMTWFFWYSTDSQTLCSTLNPDIAGVGARVSLWVPGVIVILIATLGHFHAEETGVKSVSVTLLVAQIIYGWNLLTKKTTPVDLLIGAMVLDCLTFISSVTFSMKECLAARQLIRVGHFVQFFSLLVLAKVLYGFHYDSSNETSGIPDDLCRCFQAYWWGPLNSCSGASPTFWLYFCLKTIAVVHSCWLCFYHMDHYDVAEKSARDDKNTNIKTIQKSVYDSIPATAFTKYQEWIPISISSVINIELTLAGSHLQGAQDSSSWGQTAQIFVAAAALVYFVYGTYSMFKEKNVERRQRFLNLSSFGSKIPQFPIHRSDSWQKWIQNIPVIILDHHPFNKLPLRSTDHSRMEYETEAWNEMEKYDCRQWPDKSPRELGDMLVQEAEFGDMRVLRELLLENASVTEVDKDGDTALIKATRSGHVELVNLLLESGAKPTAQNNDGETALHFAVRSNDQGNYKEVVNLLLEKTTDTTVQDLKGDTVLHVAVKRKDREMVGLLLEKTTDATIQDMRGCTVLHHAVRRRDIKILELLLENITDTSTQNDDGNTALHYAVKNGYEEIVGLLLEKTDTTIQDRDGRTVLHTAIRKRGIEQMSLAMLGGATNTRIGGNVGDGILWQILERATNTTTQDKDGNTVLHLAAKYQDPEMVEALLRKNADTMIQNNCRRIALHLATPPRGCTFIMHSKAVETVKLLLPKTTDITIQDMEGKTALHLAAERGSVEVVECLLRATESTTHDWRGMTALDYAFQEGYEEVVKILLNKVNTNLQSKYRRTTLHYAASYSHGEIVDPLLEKGTDVSIKDKNGNTPS